MNVHAHPGTRRLIRVRFVVYAIGLALALALGYASTRDGARVTVTAGPAATPSDHEPANPAENR